MTPGTDIAYRVKINLDGFDEVVVGDANHLWGYHTEKWKLTNPDPNGIVAVVMGADAYGGAAWQGGKYVMSQFTGLLAGNELVGRPVGLLYLGD